MSLASLPPLSRGVYVAPYHGPNGETVLLAITARQRLAAEPLFLTLGDREVEMADRLWALLDEADAASPRVTPPADAHAAA